MMASPRRVAQVVLRWTTRCRLTWKGVEVNGVVRLYGTPRVRLVAGSRLIIDDGVVLCGSWRANTLEARGPCILQTTQPGAVVRIGSDTGITSATISAAQSVAVGSRVLIGAGALITDSDHHHVESTVDGIPRRFAGVPTPTDADGVEIGDDVFVGARAMILKGVRVGNGSVIGAGSVVVSDVPSHVVVAGNPARIVRELQTR